MEEFKKASRVRGFHVYQYSWTPILGDRVSDLYVKMSQRSICCHGLKYLNRPGSEPGPLSGILNPRNTLK